MCVHVQFKDPEPNDSGVHSLSYAHALAGLADLTDLSDFSGLVGLAGPAGPAGFGAAPAKVIVLMHIKYCTSQPTLPSLSISHIRNRETTIRLVVKLFTRCRCSSPELIGAGLRYCAIAPTYSYDTSRRKRRAVHCCG